jgi:hypothetical protein
MARNYSIVNRMEQGVIPICRPKTPKNTTVYWHGSDTEEAFKKAKTPGYTDTSITYTFNEHGFRTRPFPKEYDYSKPNALFLGCSHTAGIGLKEEDCWPSKVAKDSRMEPFNCYNLGIGGASSDTVSRVFTNTIQSAIHPSVVFIMWPPLARFDYLQESEKGLLWDTYGPWDANRETIFLFDEANVFNNFMKNKMIVHMLAEQHKIRVLELEVDLFFQELSTLPMPKDSARDTHLAPSIHTLLAKKFISLYNASMDLPDDNS